MSYELLVTWRCDGCGFQIQTRTFAAPTGWLKPGGLSEAAGPHLCAECTKRAQMQPSNLVPIEAHPA